MSWLGPLWAWVFIALPLAFITASLWWYVRGLPQPLPPVDIMSHPSGIVRRPLTRHDLAVAPPVWAVTATSAYAVIPSASAHWGHR